MWHPLALNGTFNQNTLHQHSRKGHTPAQRGEGSEQFKQA
jgi:hypothetical protein